MSNNKWLTATLALFMAIVFTSASWAQTMTSPLDNTNKPLIQCFVPHKVKVKKKKEFSEKVDDAFGVVVNGMASVLFWQPFSFTRYQDNGEPIYKLEDLRNSKGEKLSLKYLLVDKKDDNPAYDTTSHACLSKDGRIQIDKKSGQPWLTVWSFKNKEFVHSTPFIKEDLKYLKLKDGKNYYEKSATLQAAGKTPSTVGIPLVVLVLVIGAVFYTVYYGFINFRLFKHAIDCVKGTYDDPNAPGEISHFQALTSALSATVGLGNIAGVAVAVGTGGPGAVFWMILLGLLGMTAKFHECSLAQMYRWIDSEGRVHGGPKYYLDFGLKEMGFKVPGKVLAFIFAIFVIGGSFGGGNMFQANQSFKALVEISPGMANYDWFFGITMAILVGLVILGGIKRIGQVTEKLIPFMCAIYIVASLIIIVTNISKLPHVVSLVFSEAFNFKAGVGGFMGVAIVGIKRAVFSNEAGIGSASIAHAAAKSEEPVREGIVALLEPFIDTVVICSMTAFVVLVTGAYNNPLAGSGVQMTSFAFGSVLSFFPYVLTISVILFAYSTMISWSYYGEKGWTYLFGYSKKAVTSYRVVFLFFVVLGTISSLGNVIDFSDLMILSMAFPNIIGGIWLSKKVKKSLTNYMNTLKADGFKVYK